MRLVLFFLSLLQLQFHGGYSTSKISWRIFNIEDFGATPNSGKDCTTAIHRALSAAAYHENYGGAEVLIPNNGVYITSPINITSNIILRVNGNLTALKDASKYPIVQLLPSYNYDLDLGGFHGQNLRHHPFIWSVNATNITITGNGTIDGSGSYWIKKYHDKTLQRDKIGRPHLMEIMGGEDVTIAGGPGPGLTLLNSGFWTLHPIYCNNVHIHNINIIASHCETWDDQCNPNIDGIDVDSSTNVVIENNYISVGDDHVTILSGGGEAGQKYGRPSKNVTVKNNVLGTGMGLSIGSSVSGGIEDVLYYNNIMRETRMQWGQGVHIKTRVGIGGYIKNVVWDSNVYYSTGSESIIIEAGYQSGGHQDLSNTTRIENIVLRNLTFHNSSSPGRIICSDTLPCSNITLDNVKINGAIRDEWGNCTNVVDSTFTNVMPAGLKELCQRYSPKSTDNDDDPSKKDDTIDNNEQSRSVSYTVAFLCIFFGGVAFGLLIFLCLKYDIRNGWKRIRHCSRSTVSGECREPLLDSNVIFESTNAANTVL